MAESTSLLRRLRARLTRATRLSDLLLAAFTLGFLILVLRWQYSAFVNGAFGFHDLTIISDFFSNAWVHGKPFWITNFQVTHLKTHFTPSLLVLMPWFIFFDTQFALIAIIAVCVCLGIFVASRTQLQCLRRAGIAPVWRGLLVASFLVAFAANKYTLRCLSSAHFEPLFILAVALLLHALSRGAGYRSVLPLLFFALGVRQDTGLFLFFVLLSCLVAPRDFGRVPRRSVLVAAGICVVYVVIASKLILPWFGNDGGTRFWHAWGQTWPQVFLAWAREPQRVWKAVEQSEFGAFNAELSYLPVVNPIAWVATQLPAVLFYTADSHDKPRLLYYNASFLLPGLLLCFGFAQLHLVRFVRRITPPDSRWRQLGMASICAVFIYAAFAVADPASDALQVGGLERRDPFVRAPLRELLACHEVHSVAADFSNIVFAPLWLDKYLLPNASKADLVVVAKHANKHMPFYVKPKRLVHSLLHAREYRLAAAAGDYAYYLASRLHCGT